MATSHCGYGSYDTSPVLDYWLGAANRIAVCNMAVTLVSRSQAHFLLTVIKTVNQCP